MSCVDTVERMFCHLFRCDRSGTLMEHHSLDLFSGEDNELDFVKVSYITKECFAHNWHLCSIYILERLLTNRQMNMYCS